VLLLKINYSVHVLDNRAIRRARCKATRILAMHALIFPHQQHHAVIGVFVLIEPDEVPVIPRRIRHRLVGIVEYRFTERVSIPFQASHFARFAPDAGGRIDQLADLKLAFESRTRWRTGVS
jgi:hypothetical protein